MVMQQADSRINYFIANLGSKEKVDELTKKLHEAGYEVLSGPRVTGDGYYESCILAFENNLLELVA